MHDLSKMSDSDAISALRREFGIVFDSSPKISQLGGLRILTEFLDKGKFFERLQKNFGSQKARTVLQTLLGLVAGANDFEEIARISRDPVVYKFLKRGLVSAVGATQLSRDFKAFTRAELEELHRFVSGVAIAELFQGLSQGAKVTIDVDATAVEKFGSQEGVEEGYIETDVIEPCYQYLFFRVHELDTLFYGTIRGGAAHSQNGYCEYLKRFLPILSKQWSATFRTDCGYFDEASFDLYSEYDCTFFCKAPMSQTRQSFVVASKDLVWRYDERTRAEYASYITQTKARTKYREIYKRKKSKSKSGQLALLEEVTYSYDCLATNDLVIDETEAYRFYNGRANIENTNRELKYNYALGKLVTDTFTANDAITQTTILTYVIISHLKREHLPREMRRFSLQTLRWKLFNLPGRLLVTARQELLRIKNLFAKPQDYLETFRKIRDKSRNSWVLHPPPLLAAI